MKFLPFPLIFCLLLVGCISKDETLFRNIDVADSGITFRNDLRANDSLNAFNFTNFYNGGGVGIADFNRDGIPDICFTANQADPELYLGKGGLKFEKISETGLLNPGWVTGISIVDINQDGWPDIYLSMAQHGSFKHTANQLYINQKTPQPRFKEEAEVYGLAYKGFTNQAAFFDYDLDGDLDAFLLNTAPDISNPNNLRPAVNDGSHPSSDKLFKNTGKQPDGTWRFEDVSVEAGIVYEGLGLGVALADFNEDGFTDIYCSNDFQSDDVFYLNKGDGTFRNVIKKAVKHTSLYGMGIDAADFNNDLHGDIFQLDMLPEDSERQKQMIVRGDYDKKQISISPQYNYHLQYMRNSLQVNQGMGDTIPLFSEQGFLYKVAATDWSWSVLMADFDLDGWKDVFVTNGYRKNVTDLDFITYNKNQNIFGNQQTQEKNREQILKELPEIKLKNYAFKNIPHQSFQNSSASWGLDQISYSNGAAYADLDGDGDLDLVVNNIDETAFVYENRSSNKNYVRVAFQGSEGNQEGIGASVKVYAGTLRQVYEYFPIRGYLSSMNGPLVIGLGENTGADSLVVTWPGGKKQIVSPVKAGQEIVLEEVNATMKDAKNSLSPTLFTDKNHLLDFTHKESGYVDFLHTPTLQKMLTRNGPVIEPGDFNGDSRTDVIVGGAFGGSPTVIFYQQPDGSFVPHDTLPTGALEVGAIAVMDVNQDGISDIFIAPGASENPLSVTEAFQPLLFTGNGKGFTRDISLPVLSICSESIVTHDFNEDGKTDILIGGGYMPGKFPSTFKSVLLIQEEGGLSQANVGWLSDEKAIKDMEALDIDQDGDLDIAMTGHWAGVTLLRNNGKDYAREVLSLPSGWWNCIKTGDVDNDGDPDFVLGNEGQNSIYQASAEQPVSLLVKDFNADGRLDPIWGLFLKDREVVIHPRGTLTDQIVQYKARYKLFKEYSQADLYDLFTPGDLKGAVHYQATELRTGIAINDGKGNFHFQALPLAAQQAPVNDLLIEDFNGDGIQDILLAGNFYPNEPIFGQSDASYGVLLRGKGNGQFEEWPLAQSGLKLEGDVRKMVYLRKEKLIVVTRNQDKTLVFSH
ncbi:MAG: VCBS repeat-containing protein [Bacteroidia bacterium]|nr:VCBS repeat-containing protein [Bacteroidia bacterium]